MIPATVIVAGMNALPEMAQDFFEDEDLDRLFRAMLRALAEALMADKLDDLEDVMDDVFHKVRQENRERMKRLGYDNEPMASINFVRPILNAALLALAEQTDG